MLPGDGLVEDPTVIDTRTIEVDAAPEDVWPWLVQMGYGRAGWYSYDQLNQKGRSAEEVMPEWQGLAVGDTMPLHPGGGFAVKILEPARALVLYVDNEMTAGWRGTADSEGTDATMPDAEAAKPPRTGPRTPRPPWPTARRPPRPRPECGMLSSKMPAEFRGTWAFVLEPTDDGRTRLIERLRFRFDGPQPAGAELAMEAMGFGLFLMMRRQMLGIRDRAERTAQSKMPVPVVNALEALPA